jgi:hypothetical protein
MKSLLPSLLDAVDPLDVYALLAARPLGCPSGMHDLQLQRWPSPSGGRSGGLGGPSDHRLFFVLRALTDVVLVDAGKTRTQGNGPVRLDDAGRAAAGFNIMNAPHWTPPPTKTRLVELPATFAATRETVHRKLGVPAGSARTAAIGQHVMEMPAPVVADALSHHPVTTAKIATQVGVTWSHYAPGDHTRTGDS